MEKSDIYKITCKDCGQTGRCIKKRLNEHLTRNDSYVYKHITDNHHNIDRTCISLLHQIKKSRKMDILEDYEIHKHLRDTPDFVLNSMIYLQNNHLYVY